MTEKIDIAEILKDKPANTKLYSPLFGEVYFSHVGGGNIAVEHHGGISLFFSSGRFFDYDESEPLLFPSKEMRDWRKFAWKKGDVLVNSRGLKILFDRWANDNYTSFYAKTINLVEDGFLDTNLLTLASEKEAKSFIKCIEEKLGGKLNRETLEVEKTQPEFKDGDIAFADYGNRQDVFIVSGITGLSEGYSSFISIDLSSLTLSMGCRISFFKKDLCKLRLATDSEKKQLFDALEKEGKAWDAEKKQIVDLKPKVELNPFDNVLVRHQKTEEWRANIFSHTDKTDEYLHYVCVNGRWEFCIPYEGNESLLGTTKDVEVSYGRSF